MKYLLFAGEEYYPLGGMNDFVAKGDSVECLRMVLKEVEVMPSKFIGWWHIVDIENFTIVAGSCTQGWTSDDLEGGEDS